MLVVDLLFLAVSLAALFPAATAWPIKQKDYERRNFKTLERIYNLTIFPHQVPILTQGAAAVPPGLFNESVVGRVDPVGNFTSFQDSIEYFFALAPVPQPNSTSQFTSQFISRIQLTEFSSACASVAASVVYFFTNVYNPGCPDHGKALPPLKQVAFWKFDNVGAVLKYDAWLPNLNAWIEASMGVPISNPQVQAGTIQQLCGVTQQRCTGNNTQWSSIEQCVTTLSQKPYGNYDEAWGDNIVCRTIHLFLTQVRPQVHCPHVGPTGGNKCVNYAYPLQYFNDQALYGNRLGDTFQCH